MALGRFRSTTTDFRFFFWRTKLILREKFCIGFDESSRYCTGFYDLKDAGDITLQEELEWRGATQAGIL